MKLELTMRASYRLPVLRARHEASNLARCFFALCTSLCVNACVDSSPRSEEMAGGEDGATAMGTGGTASAAGATNATAGPGPDTSKAIACPTPTDSLIMDFTDDPSGEGVQATFGDFTETFSGGTFVYPSEETMPLYPLTSDVTEGDWHITGEVGDYSGFGLFFQDCTKFDASAFDGIEFTIRGDVGMGNTLEFRVGTAANTVSHEWLHENGQTAEPVNFGRCIPPGSNQYDGSCTEPKVSVTVTDTPEVVTVLWEDLTGGSPESFVTPSELTSIAWALPAPSGVGTESVITYSVDLVIDDLRFVDE